MYFWVYAFCKFSIVLSETDFKSAAGTILRGVHAEPACIFAETGRAPLLRRPPESDESESMEEVGNMNGRMVFAVW